MDMDVINLYITNKYVVHVLGALDTKNKHLLPWHSGAQVGVGRCSLDSDALSQSAMALLTTIRTKLKLVMNISWI